MHESLVVSIDWLVLINICRNLLPLLWNDLPARIKGSSRRTIRRDRALGFTTAGWGDEERGRFVARAAECVRFTDRIKRRLGRMACCPENFRSPGVSQ